MRDLSDKDLILEVSREGTEANAPLVQLTIPASGFEFDDVIVGTSDPGSPAQPWKIQPLPRDTTDAKEDRFDYFAYRERMRRLAGQPVVIQVSRAKTPESSELLNILVPPAFHRTFGMRMKMGKIAGVRDKSSAAGAGVQKGDELKKVVMLHEDKSLREFVDIDPLRLPFELEQEAKAKPGRKMVTLTVLRANRENHNAADSVALTPAPWDEKWDTSIEEPRGSAAPMSIPQLGLAYWVESTVVAVEKGSPADLAEIKPNDQLVEMRFREARKKLNDDAKWDDDWFKLFAIRESNPQSYDKWAHVDLRLQLIDYPEVQVKVVREGSPLAESITMTAKEDTSWPQENRGLGLIVDTRLIKADSIREAFLLGGQETVEVIVKIYTLIQRMFERRIPAKHMGGPIEIFKQTFFAAGQDFSVLLGFLASISLNLAVVNFLPIPLLDGGHMVLLIYEKLRGRPASEAVRAGAAYLGAAMLLALVVFVFYNDIRRTWFPG